VKEDGGGVVVVTIIFGAVVGAKVGADGIVLAAVIVEGVGIVKIIVVVVVGSVGPAVGTVGAPCALIFNKNSIKIKQITKYFSIFISKLSSFLRTPKNLYRNLISLSILSKKLFTIRL
jgi:hypothetical protein